MKWLETKETSNDLESIDEQNDDSFQDVISSSSSDNDNGNKKVTEKNLKSDDDDDDDFVDSMAEITDDEMNKSSLGVIGLEKRRALHNKGRAPPPPPSTSNKLLSPPIPPRVVDDASNYVVDKFKETVI